MASGTIKIVPVACLLAITASIGTGRISFAQNFGTRTEATSCAAAIGGNVTFSTVSVVCGIAPEVLDALVRSRTQPFEELATALKDGNALLKEKLDLTQRQMSAALDILGEANVPPERLAAKLLEIAERFKDLQQTAIAKPGDDAKIAALKFDAQKAIGEGDLDKADKLLADVELQQRQAHERLAADEAQTAAQRGDIAMIRLRYGEAAKRYADAAAVLSSETSNERRLDYLNREAKALYQQGSEFGDNAALHGAIDRYRRIVDLRPREHEPWQWVIAQDHLANALLMLGTREATSASLEEAVAVFREALDQCARGCSPLETAKMQDHLGSALVWLGKRESGTTRLEQAVAALRAALEVRTRERVPLLWAITENDLGRALYRLGQREPGTARLEEAVTAYRGALEELTRERVPLDWATVEFNLGNVLVALGMREPGTARLEEAVAAFRNALKEYKQERVPLSWAWTQDNLGYALAALGRRERSAARLEEAIAAYHAALKECTPERSAECAVIEKNLGATLKALDEQRSAPP